MSGSANPIIGRTPNWIDGYVPPAAEWNAWWAQKLDASDPFIINGPYLPLTGGVLSGRLTLAVNPINPLDAVTKAYVDNSSISGGPYLALSGGTMLGRLTLVGEPLAPFDAATKSYVDASGSAGGPFLPIAGGMITGSLAITGPGNNLVANVTATGGNTARDLRDHFADWLNVKDFGAVHDGVTDNLAAFNATRAAASLNGSIQVPRGQLKFPNGISGGLSTPVLWQTDGTTFPGGTAPIVTLGMPGDVTEGFFNGNKYFGKRSALKGPGATLRVDMIQSDTTGGSITDICGGISVVTQQNLGNTNSVWGFAVVGDNYADVTSGGMVGIQSTVRKHAGADCWAIQTVTLDDTGLASSANGHGFVGAEIAVRTHGLDDASNAESYGGVGIRNAIHLTLNRSNILPGNTNPDDLTSFAHGIWVSGDSAATKTYVGSVYAVGMSMKTYSVFDSRGAGVPFGYTDPVAAVRMSAGQIVDFNGGPALNSAAGNYLQYTTTGTPRLRYMDGAAELWAVSDTGAWSGSTVGFGIGQVPAFANRGGRPSYELNGQWIINQAAPTGTQGADIFIRHDGSAVNTGTSANINSMMNMTMAVGANDPTSNWGLVVHPSTNQTTGGQTLAAFLATDRLPGSNAHIWGALINVSCQTGLSSSAVGQATLGQENDFASSLADDAVNPAKWGGIGNRHLVHYIVTRFTGATQNEVTTGLWFGTTNSYIDSVIGFDVGSGGGCCVRQVVDTRGAIPPTGVTDPVASVRMSAGQIIDFNGGPALNSAPGNYLQYTTTGTPRLRYMDATLERLSIDDAGNLSISGSITAGGSVSASGGSFIPISQKAQPNGVASLDATGVVPTSQLPGTVTGTLNYRGGWNASTNTPAMTSGAHMGGVVQAAGNYWVVTVSATTAAIDGITAWTAGDWISSNGTTWEKVQNSSSPYLPLSGGTVTGATTFNSTLGVIGVTTLGGNAVFSAATNHVGLATFSAAGTALNVLSNATIGGTLSVGGLVSGAGITTLLSPYALTSSVPLASSTVPIMDGTAAAGAGTTWARADHVHPVDTSRYAASNPSGYQTAAQVSASITAAAYTLPTASTTVLGGVKVDGTTVTIAGGVISSTATGGGSLVYTATGGTLARSAQDRAADWINILDLGAIGDGVTDDTAAFVAASGKPSGTTIFLPANKTFLITAQSYTFSNRCVSLIGGDRHSTIIRLKPSSPAMTAGLFFWNGPNRPGPVISNFTLDVNSNSASAYGQSLIGISVPTSRPEISNVSVINMGSLCLAFGGTSWATGGEIRNCYVQQSVASQTQQSKAISLSIFSTIPNVGVRILNNTFVNTNVLLTGTQKCLIEGNEISGWGVGAGVAMGWNVADTVSSFDNTIVNNKCHDSQPGQDTFGVTPNGLELWTDRGVIAGNHCWNNSGSGLLVGGKNGLVVGNIAYDNNVFNAAGQAGMVALYASATHNASFTTWIGNKSYDSGVGRQQYGFGSAGSVVGVTLISNDFSGPTGQTNLVGANPIVNPFLDALFGRQMAASTGDIQGNIYIPFCNGVPTGIPAWSAAGIALKYDIANHKLWAYDNSLNSWQGFDSTPAPDQLVLYRSGTAAGNGADTTLDVLQSYTLPANTLAAVGDILHIVAGGTLAPSTDNKQIRVYFGSAVAMQVSATAAGTTQWACEVWITKTGPSTQSFATLANVFSNFTNGTGGGTSTINDTAPQVIQVTGQNNTNPVAGSIVCQFLSVELLR